MLYQQRQLLIEFHDVWTPMYEVLDGSPLLEFRIIDLCLQLAAAERGHYTTKEL